jgi:ribonuclease P protein component
VGGGLSRGGGPRDESASPRRDVGLPKEMRLCRGAEFRRVFAYGRRKTNRLLTLYYLRNDGGARRVGLVVSRRVGKAVERNKVRRRLQEILRQRWDELKDGRDLVLVVRKDARNAGFRQLAKAVEDVVARAGLTEGENDESGDGSLEVDGGRP